MRLISDVLAPAFGTVSFPGTTISLSQDPLATPGDLYILYTHVSVCISSRLDLVGFAALFFSSSLFPASIPLFSSLSTFDFVLPSEIALLNFL